MLSRHSAFRKFRTAVFLDALLSVRFDVAAAGSQKKAPAWKFQSVSGELVSLESFRGKVVVVSFGATWCPPCREELPALQEIADRYQGKGVQVLWVSVDERKVSDEQLRQFAAKFGLKVPVLRYPQTVAYADVGDGSLPMQVIIGRDGKFAGSPQIGFSNRSAFMSEVGGIIDRLL